MKELIEKYVKELYQYRVDDGCNSDGEIRRAFEKYTEELNLYNEKQKVLNLPMIVDEYASLIHHLNNDINYEDIELLLEKMLYKVVTEVDFRTLMRYSDWTTDCLWYLGDKTQRDYHNNGWVNYRFKSMLDSIHQIPSENKVYQVYYNDTVDEAYWNGEIFIFKDNSFKNIDKYITHWKEILKPKD